MERDGESGLHGWNKNMTTNQKGTKQWCIDKMAKKKQNWTRLGSTSGQRNEHLVPNNHNQPTETLWKRKLKYKWSSGWMGRTQTEVPNWLLILVFVTCSTLSKLYSCFFALSPFFLSFFPGKRLWMFHNISEKLLTFLIAKCIVHLSVCLCFCLSIVLMFVKLQVSLFAD